MVAHAASSGPRPIGTALGMRGAQAATMPPNKTHTLTALCANCLYHGDCTFEKQAKDPVLHCELHTLPSAPERPARTRPTVTHAMVGPGLCGSCDHRDHCSLRVPDRIVLHCEHYQ